MFTRRNDYYYDQGALLGFFVLVIFGVVVIFGLAVKVVYKLISILVKKSNLKDNKIIMIIYTGLSKINILVDKFKNKIKEAIEGKRDDIYD